MAISTCLISSTPDILDIFECNNIYDVIKNDYFCKH